ncbi:MAG: hypothetical protein RIQ88_442 [Actinomycetota bacterium]
MSDDTSLSELTVAGQDAIGGSVTVPAGTRAVSVSAVTTDPFASYTVSGNTDLQSGDNEVTVTVTAADGTTTEDITITVTVSVPPLSNVTSVTSITVAGQDAMGGSVNVGIGTRGVLVKVVTTDPFATYVVADNTDLQPGENTVTVTVTAQDGETTQDYSITVNVPLLSDDTSLALFQINGVDVNDGDAIELPNGTKRVSVKVQVTDIGATFTIAGSGRTTPLVEGDQELVVTVFAENGDEATYTITLTVLPISQNADLAEEDPVLVNGEAVDSALLNNPTGYLDLATNTTRIAIAATAADSMADVFINGKTVLPGKARLFSMEVGVNTMTITVIPEAGVDYAKDYVLKIYVGGADATLKTTKVGNTLITFVNGEGALGTPLPNGTLTTTLYVEPTIALKSGSNLGTVVSVSGDGITATAGANFGWTLTGLVTFDNVITITVAPGDPSADPVDYTLTIPVAPSSDKTLKGNAFKIDGVSYPVGSTKVFPLDTTSVELDAETTNVNATFEVSGGDELVPGLNELVVTVTAEDGVSEGIYKIFAIVPAGKHVLTIPFAKAGLLTIDKKTNAAADKILTGEVTTLTKAKSTIAKVEIANDYLVAKDKPTAGPARATALQKYFQALKVPGAKTAVYVLAKGLPKPKGLVVTIYYY